ncbi:hypothetical protein D3C76_1228740 [compost metagenome]
MADDIGAKLQRAAGTPKAQALEGGRQCLLVALVIVDHDGQTGSTVQMLPAFIDQGLLGGCQQAVEQPLAYGRIAGGVMVVCRTALSARDEMLQLWPELIFHMQ